MVSRHKMGRQRKGRDRLQHTHQQDRVKSCNSKQLVLYNSSYWFTQCVNIERFVECDFLICKALLWLADWDFWACSVRPWSIVLAFSLGVTTNPRQCVGVSSFQQREDRSLSLCSIVVSMSLEELYTPRGHYLCARHCTGTMAIMKQQIMRSSGHQHLQSHFYIIWFTPPPARTTINRLRPLSSLAQSDKICKYCKQSAVGQLISSPPVTLNMN